ncbi:MAG TPA: NAD(P)H-hydrate dehydratase [Cellvibrio sp.]|nr:NAD(P)H-hydrate dehydratase [Cellvibrio sp.]
MKITASDSSLYTASQVYALDAAAIASGIPGIQLMKRAGQAAYELLLQRFPNPELISVYCGAGKNGGDGYVLAALARQRLLPVQVIQLAAPDKLAGEARQAYEYALQEGVKILPFAQASVAQSGVIVDALLGIGLQGDVRPEFAAAIAQINNAGLPVLSIDIPSGLNSDSGTVQGAVVKAALTITYIGIKRGLVTGRGPACSGDIVLSRLDIPDEVYRQSAADGQARPSAEILSLSSLLELLAEREADVHKGDFGHVMIIGGDSGYGGAAIMAAEAAARTGAGLVSLATRPEHIPAILARRPEIMACGVVSGQELEPLLTRPTVLVVGPGLGRSPWSEQMLQQAVRSGLPMVLDADALNILAEGRVVPDLAARSHWLFTPHPGEAARLLGVDIAQVQADRFASAARIQQKFGAVVVLKGAGSLVVDEAATGVVVQGNPGMASGGMGDVLSGILGGLIAQGLSLANAARLGVVLHANAADLAADEVGQRSLLATDLLPYLCQLLSD